MPFGPVLAIFVFVFLCLHQQLAEEDKKRAAKAKQEKEAEKKAELMAELIKKYMK